MGTGFAKKKKEARALQEKLSQVQQQLKETTVTGSAGSGLVTITMNGDYEIKKLTIKPECVDPNEVECLEDLVKKAFNNACEQIKNASFGGMEGMPSFDQLGSQFSL